MEYRRKTGRTKQLNIRVTDTTLRRLKHIRDRNKESGAGPIMNSKILEIALHVYEKAFAPNDDSFPVQFNSNELEFLSHSEFIHASSMYQRIISSSFRGQLLCEVWDRSTSYRKKELIDYIRKSSSDVKLSKYRSWLGEA